MTDLAKWTLIDKNLSTVLGEFQFSTADLYFVVNDNGSGSLKIPMDSRLAEILDNGMVAILKYRGETRYGFLIDNISRDYVSQSNVDGGEWMTISGRGALSLLEDAILYPNSGGGKSREFSGTKASILLALLSEAQSRGAIASVTCDFTGTHDSDSIAWVDNINNYTIQIGTSLRDTVSQFADMGLNIEMRWENGAFVLSAFENPIGTDRSSSVFLRVGKNCTDVSSTERSNDLKNALLLSWRGGASAVNDDVSISANRRREKYINIAEAQSSESATTYGAAVIANSKNPRVGYEISVWDGVNPALFDDYNYGDTITLDRFGRYTQHKILGLRCR